MATTGAGDTELSEQDDAERNKARWRRQILAARRALDSATRAREADALAEHSAELAAGCAVTCAYVPVGTEPGSLALLHALRAQGSQVLLPRTREPGALDWAEFTDVDNLVPARHGLREPGGPALGPEAVAQADLVLLPALAVDRSGTRLGRGAGFYDRSLAAARKARLVAVVRTEEVLPRLPREPHDIPVHWALTPAGLIRLGLTL